MIVLDTTTLVYSVGQDHPLRDPCRDLVTLIQRGEITATTTVEVIQEFTHVRSRRRGREDAANLGRAYADLLSPLLVVEEGDLHNGLALFERHPRLGTFDAVLAAAARSVEAAALVSTDTAFREVPHLAHIVPDKEGLERLRALTTE